MTPQISVLIPIRNAASTLDEALASLAAQTFREWEAVVVDDGSTDATPALLAEWARRDPRFRVWRGGPPGGLVSALNQALAAARAPVLARMDADDVSLPRRFERQLRRLEQGDATVVGCHVRYFPEEAVGGGARRYEAWLNSLTTPAEHDRDIFVECPVAHPTLMLPAAALRAAGGYQERGWPEDYDLCLRLWEAGHRFAKVPELLFHWRERPDRASRTHLDYRREAFWRCKARYLRRGPLAGPQPALLFGAGPVGKAAARALLAEGAFLAAFVDLDPRKIGQRIYDLPVLDQPEALARRGGVFGLVALGQPGARDTARATLLEAGWEEGADFRCIA